MKINIRQAKKLFFKNPSLENVFTEAIHNSIDAGASKIDIDIYIDALDKSETLIVKITDNGIGFIDERYEKFCELMNVEEDSHKGVGRLVYLFYFDKISIMSKYEGKQRTFTYDNDFDELHSDMRIINLTENFQETTIVFGDCVLKQLGSYNSIFPEHLRIIILNKLYPILYLMKKNGKELNINIKLEVKTIKKGQHIGKEKQKSLYQTFQLSLLKM